MIQAAKNYATDCESGKKTEYLYKASNFVGKAEYYKSYLDGVWAPIKPPIPQQQRGNTYSFDQLKRDSIVKRQAKADCKHCNGTGKVSVKDHMTDEVVSYTCECCKISQ